MKIETSYVHPPIPSRDADWAAWDSDTYCGCGECRCPVGRGPTESAAIEDLNEQLAELA